MLPYGVDRYVMMECPCCNVSCAARKSRIHPRQKSTVKRATRRAWKRKARAEGKAQASTWD